MGSHICSATGIRDSERKIAGSDHSYTTLSLDGYWDIGKTWDTVPGLEMHSILDSWRWLRGLWNCD